MPTFGKAYLGDILLTGGDAPPPAEWVRPSDWLPMPTLTAEVDEEFAGLFAVGDHASNFVAFRFSGAVTVDWGDGSAPENVASATTAEHNFSYADLGAGTEFQLAETGETYRQAIIRVTPQAANQITSISLNFRHSQAGISAYATPWLDVAVCAGNCTSLTLSGTTGLCRLMERANVIEVGTITTGTNMFQNCTSLQSVPLFDFSSLTNGGGMFSGCRSLQSVPLFDLSSMTSGLNMFLSCTSLQSVPLFDLSAMTTGTSMFSGCASLQSVPLFDLSAMTSGANMFLNCTSLQSVPLFDFSSLTNGGGMFSGCTSNARTRATGIQATISFANNKMGPDELDELYTNLATVTAKTITVTGNWGKSASDETIATGKGWTVS